MSKLFIDTSAFVALADSRDDNHVAAAQFNQNTQRRSLFTSNYILDELHTLLLLNVGYPKTVQFKTKLDRLIQTRLLTVIWIAEELANQTWDIFQRFNMDKQWSFTDCSSYVIMKNQAITDVFTYDHPFAQMGFTLKGRANSAT